MQITVKNYQKKVSVPRTKVLKAAKTALLKLGLQQRSLSIVFVGAGRMRTANRKYLNHDYVTDVLTFDLGEGVGEIIICPQVACSNAAIYETSTVHELILYVVHGILHLAGYDDHRPEDQSKMRRMEQQLLKLD